MSFKLDKAREQAKAQSKQAKQSVKDLVKPKTKQGRPPKPKSEVKLKQINIRIHEDLLNKVNKKLEKEPRSRTLTSIITAYLEEYIKRGQ